MPILEFDHCLDGFAVVHGTIAIWDLRDVANEVKHLARLDASFHYIGQEFVEHARRDRFVNAHSTVFRYEQHRTGLTLFGVEVAIHVAGQISTRIIVTQ